MRAEIVKIQDEKVQLIDQKNKLITLDKSNLGFDCVVGDIILIERKHFKDQYYLIDKESTVPEARPEKKPTVKRTILALLVVVLIASGTAAGFLIYNWNEQRKKEELVASFNDCILNAHKSVYPNSITDDIEAILDRYDSKPFTDGFILYVGDEPSTKSNSKEYEKAIQCYEKYQVDGYQEKIDNLTLYKKIADASTCAAYAQKNGQVTEAEVNGAANNMAATIALITRIGNGLQEQINCYENSGVADEFQEALSKLRTKKSENDAYLESAKNTSNNGGRTNLYCTTSTIGGTTYTNCY